MAHLHECLVTLVCNYEVVSFSRFKSKYVLPETRNVIVANARPTRHCNQSLARKAELSTGRLAD
jgi:hypothetical protein